MQYDEVDPLINNGAYGLEILNTLASNDRYFNRIIPNISYKWYQNARHRSNGGGTDRVTVQSGTVLIPKFKKEAVVNVKLNYAAKDNFYAVTYSLRGPEIAATMVTTGQTTDGFRVKVLPINKTTEYSGVHLVWIAVVGIPN